MMTADRWLADGPLRVGVSACLLGEPVRWDGGHKRDRFLTDRLARYVEWVPVCPELELGLGVPRETLRLERRDGAIALRNERSGRDWTRPMQRYAAKRARELRALDLCGYVLKKDSPSCGLERVRIWNASGQAERRGRGLFAHALVEANPGLPIEEEGRLHDPLLRENFIEQLFARRRLRRLFRARWTRGALVAFHSAHKLQLMAHSPAHFRSLGRLVAQVKQLPRAELRARYTQEFAAALSVLSTRRRHVNVLQHMQGYFRKRLDDPSRAELHEVIRDYAAERIPLIVPLTLIRHHVRVLAVAYLEAQVYLDPHPKELMLRNHV